MEHDFYKSVDWQELLKRKTITPYTPILKDPTDTSHFDAQQTGIPIQSPPKHNSELKKIYEADNGNS